LVFGWDKVLVQTRCLILKRAGFDALDALEIADAELMLKDHNVALLVVCSSVEQESISKVLNAASSIRPSVKTLVINNSVPNIAGINADFKIEGLSPPAFLTAVDKVLGIVRM
jgi:hypothetical protein